METVTVLLFVLAGMTVAVSVIVVTAYLRWGHELHDYEHQITSDAMDNWLAQQRYLRQLNDDAKMVPQDFVAPVDAGIKSDVPADGPFDKPKFSCEP